MSVETNETLNTTKSERAWRMTVDTKKGEQYVATFHQEVTHTKDGETVPFSKVRMPDVSRAVLNADGSPTPVTGETVTLASGKTVSVAEILEAGSLFSDKWRGEDSAV